MIQSHSFSLRLPAEPASLAPLRARLTEWLQESGVDGGVTFDVVSAASEAASNAIEHAREPREPLIEVAAERHGDLLTIRVRDFGNWRAPRFDSDRNRGLLLISGLMSHVDVDRSQDGTTVTMRLDLAASRSSAKRRDGR
jgi:anti-sigma regulatory factor (Ser/Thr protein kinase)